MRFEIKLGTPSHPIHVEFRRNPWIGTVTAKVNGEGMTLRSLRAPTTHLSSKRLWRYEIPIQDALGGALVVEHERPWLFGGLRPQEYRVLLGGQQLAAHTGY